MDGRERWAARGEATASVEVRNQGVLGRDGEDLMV